jgi:hypothetical protein
MIIYLLYSKRASHLEKQPETAQEK